MPFTRSSILVDLADSFLGIHRLRVPWRRLKCVLRVAAQQGGVLGLDSTRENRCGHGMLIGGVADDATAGIQAPPTKRGRRVEELIATLLSRPPPGLSNFLLDGTTSPLTRLNEVSHDWQIVEDWTESKTR
jgi:hypothetical protein